MNNKPYPLYEIERVNNLKELVDHAAKKYGDKPAFTFERNNETVSINYNRFKADIEALGTAFLDVSIEQTKVAVIGENSYEWILSYFATVNSGNVIVPLDKELPAADIKNLIDESGTEVFLYSDSYSDIAEYLRNTKANIKHYISMSGIPELIEKGEELIRHGRNSVTDYEIENHALTAILYTSGTTGMSKGVMLSHYGLAQNAYSGRQYIEVLEKSMLVLPLHHTFGFTGGISAMLITGVEVYINSSLKNVLSDIEKSKPHCMLLVPLFVETFYKKIWDGAEKQGKDKILKVLLSFSNALLKVGIDLRMPLFKSVRKALGGNLNLLITGGAPIDKRYIQGFRDFGINILNGYGITECSPMVSVNRNDYNRDSSVGLVLSTCCDVKIAEPDENGHGEIYVKGDIVMLGYYNNEQATKEAFDGEWFRTGDIGYMDSDGFLYITGRKKNLIVLSNGKNVYPEEIEFALLNTITYIKEAIVFQDNDTIAAEVFLDTENNPDCVSRLSDDINEFNRTQPQFLKIGKTFVRDTEFPKTTTKKIKRAYKD